MTENIQEILLSEEQIQAKVKELAAQLTEEYKDKDPIFIGVLKGVVVFFGDFIKYFDAPCQIDFMWVPPITAQSPPIWRSSGISLRISKVAMW